MNIKFRAWSKVYSQMLIVTNINFRDDMIIAQNLDGDRPLQLVNPSNQFDIMQCTGTLDKNNIDIYAGDIVIYQDKKWIVKYFSKYARFGLSTNYEENKMPLLLSMISDNCEVIGNIYEHGGLLRE